MRVRLVHEFGGSHQIGHFRLSTSADGRTRTPLSVMNIVMTPPNKRNAKQKAALQNYLIGRYGGPELAKLSGELSRLRADRDRTTVKVPETMVMTEMPTPRQTYVLERGSYLPCSQYEAMFVSAAHSETDVDDTIAAATDVLAG